VQVRCGYLEPAVQQLPELDLLPVIVSPMPACPADVTISVRLLATNFHASSIRSSGLEYLQNWPVDGVQRCYSSTTTALLVVVAVVQQSIGVQPNFVANRAGTLADGCISPALHDVAVNVYL
jgi:hypothetical protein